MALIDVNEASQVLGFTKQRTYALVRNGLIPAVHVGRQVRFDPDAIQKWISGGGKALPGGWRQIPTSTEPNRVPPKEAHVHKTAIEPS